LRRSWTLTALALSGVFGNVDIDGRNSYAAMHAVGSESGLSPRLKIAPIPVPAPLAMLAVAIGVIILAGRRWNLRVA